jgi:hypothetical protein
MRSNSNAWYSSCVWRMGDNRAYSDRDCSDTLETALPARYRSPGRSDLPHLQLELIRRVLRESTPSAKPGEEENNKIRRRELLSFFHGSASLSCREARRAFGNCSLKAAASQSRPKRLRSVSSRLIPLLVCSAPLYAMRETSQRPDRCAVVPLMGSRAVGSTVRL